MDQVFNFRVKFMHVPIPVLSALKKLGSDIKDARKRRRIPLALMEERAGISRYTIIKIEKGQPTTSIGNYATVLFVLGMVDRLRDLVDSVHDVIGRQLQDEVLPKRIRFPKDNK